MDMPLYAPTIDDVNEANAPRVTRYRQLELGPIALGETAFNHDWTLECEDVGLRYHIQLPVAGRFESRHLGVRTACNRANTPVYRPGAGSFAGRWEKGTRTLCVRIAPGPVDEALGRLMGDQAPNRIRFSPTMNTAEGYGRAWAELLLLLRHQLLSPDGMLHQPLMSEPLAESVVNGFLLASAHSYSAALSAPAAAARPIAVRTAVDVIEADPRAALTVAALAQHCGVAVRTLQEGFHKHLGMSPMAYVRAVRLRYVHEELRAADPASQNVADIARAWGFYHQGRFAAAHEARYGQHPLATLRSTG
jgi:AraC-like DNA-binding protein